MPPSVPAVFDNCGRPITVAAPTIAYDTTCGGTVIYSYAYTGCDNVPKTWTYTCLLYTSDAADERSSVDLGGRRIIKKKPTVPAVFDNCGRPIPVAAQNIAYGTACGGTWICSCAYTGCDNVPKTWTY